MKVNSGLMVIFGGAIYNAYVYNIQGNPETGCDIYIT